MKKLGLPLISIIILLLLAGCGGSSSHKSSTKTNSTQYTLTGKILEASSADWGTVSIYNNKDVPYDFAYVNNNVWNKAHAADGPNEQMVFSELIDGKTAYGWQWNWAMSQDVVAYPEIELGAKPWDVGYPMQKGGKYPFLAGSKDLTANFDIRLNAEGKYNMAFSIWAMDNSQQNITHEIMIWNCNNGCTPAGTKQGTVTVDGVEYNVYINDVQHDNSGSNSQTWKYVAFEASTNVFHGPLHLSQFIDYMITHGIISSSNYICDVEFGNEIVGGKGVTEIQNFSIDLVDRKI